MTLIPKEKREYEVYQVHVPIPDNLLHSSYQEKENTSPYDDCLYYLWQMLKKGAITFNHTEVCVSYRQVQKAKTKKRFNWIHTNAKWTSSCLHT